MKVANLKSIITLALGLVLINFVTQVRAGAPTRIPAWFNDEIMSIIPGVSSNVVGVTNHAIATNVANPLYVVAGQEVSHILGVAAPGVAGYNPYWDIVMVTVLNGRDLTTDPFTSEDEILAAAEVGDVELDDTGFILLCQVVSR